LFIQKKDEKNGGGRGRRWNENRGEIKKFEINVSLIRPSIIVKPKLSKPGKSSRIHSMGAAWGSALVAMGAQGISKKAVLAWG